MYLPASSVGKNKFDVRWMDGVWLEIKMVSVASVIGAAGGVVKARDFRRKPEERGRWSNDGVEGLFALNVDGNLSLSTGGLAFDLISNPSPAPRYGFQGTPFVEEYAPRRMRIAKEDLEKL